MSLAACCIVNLVSCAATLACLPSESTDVGRFQPATGHASRTVNDYVNILIDTLHFVTYVLCHYSRLLAV